MENRNKIFNGKNSLKNKNNFRFILFSILYSLSSILFLSFCSPVHAEVVTLKNGRVMIGRIVEKNPRYLVLKRGEGDDAVKTTIFLEDISRIEGEEKSISVFGDSREAIRNLVEEDLLLRAQGNTSAAGFESPAESQEPENTSGAAGYEASPASGGPENTSETHEPPATPEESGTGGGEISGTVTLPYPSSLKPHEAGASGALYVYLTRENERGAQVLTVPVFSDRINADSIASLLVPYVIRHVPVGRYHVNAAWDVA